MNKLQIYYQPVQTNREHHESLTISYSEFDEVNNTYKQKIVLEFGGEKYKIKKYPTGYFNIKKFLETLDLSKYKSSDIDYGAAYYYIKFGEQVLATSNKDDIRDILEWAGFEEILGYGLGEYQKC